MRRQAVLGSYALSRSAAAQNRNARLPIRLASILFLCALTGCGEPDPVRLPLSALKTSQLEFNGRQVVVSGVLRTFEEPRHYWIENTARDRVALDGAAGLAPLVGQRIEVSGRFTYDRDAGRRIEVVELRKLP